MQKIKDIAEFFPDIFMIKTIMQFDLTIAFWSMSYELDFTRYGVCTRKPKIGCSFMPSFFHQKVMNTQENSILGPSWVLSVRF